MKEAARRGSEQTVANFKAEKKNITKDINDNRIKIKNKKLKRY